MRISRCLTWASSCASTPASSSSESICRMPSVAATEGILQMLSDEELAGVLAHELAHVKHRDILISSVRSEERRVGKECLSARRRDASRSKGYDKVDRKG